MMSAFIFIQIEGVGSLDEMRSVHDALHAVSGVKTVHFVAGPTDVIVYAEAADQQAFGQTLGGIRQVRGVARTDTRFVWPM